MPTSFAFFPSYCFFFAYTCDMIWLLLASLNGEQNGYHKNRSTMRLVEKFFHIYCMHEEISWNVQFTYFYSTFWYLLNKKYQYLFIHRVFLSGIFVKNWKISDMIYFTFTWIQGWVRENFIKIHWKNVFV